MEGIFKVNNIIKKEKFIFHKVWIKWLNQMNIKT
jgi:hypothetical protein